MHLMKSFFDHATGLAKRSDEIENEVLVRLRTKQALKEKGNNQHSTGSLNGRSQRNPKVHELIFRVIITLI